jgi:hypothetical protein
VSYRTAEQIQADTLKRLNADGGPAFPDHALPHRHNGMSLRDYFAGQALTLIGRMIRVGSPKDTPTVARMAYEIADAMIAEREKTV